MKSGMILLSVLIILLAACRTDVNPLVTAPPLVTAVPNPTPDLIVTPMAYPDTEPLPPPPSPYPATEIGTEESAIHRYTYQVINSYPHDPNAYTQGLVYEDGVFYEGTGLEGHSTLRRVDVESGVIQQRISLDAKYFGEGIVVWQDRIIQLTWRENTGFVYDKSNFELLQEFNYPTEGWGITHDGQQLIMSDGSATLYFWDPDTLTEIGRLEVFDENGPVVRLNELEYVAGEVWANVWQTDLIARIDLESGQVVGWIDLAGLLDTAVITQPVDVLNGIAYDDATGRLFVTGKWWPQVYEIELILVE